jgi:hypothetical protein
VIYNNVSSTFGTGINAVAPGHEIDSLKIGAVSYKNMLKHSMNRPMI